MSLEPASSPAPAATSSKTSAAAVWSLILGILSMFCLWLLGSIPAIILGIVGMRNVDSSNGALTGKGLALAGIITGSVGILTGISAVGIMASLTVPAYSRVKMRSEITLQMNELRMARMACHAFAADNNGQFPPTLEALIPEYLDEGTILIQGDELEGEEGDPYLYRPGLTTSGDASDILILGHPDRDGKRIAVYVSGEVERLDGPIDSELLEQFE